MILSALSYQAAAIETGATYRRCGVGALEELALVLDVAKDRMGIPHVRYELQVKRGSGMPTVESRTLSLEAFQTRYREKIGDGRRD